MGEILSRHHSSWLTLQVYDLCPIYRYGSTTRTMGPLGCRLPSATWMTLHGVRQAFKGCGLDAPKGGLLDVMLWLPG